MQLSQYPRYQDYVDSPVPWLGEVPSDWLFEKGKWHLSNRKALNSDGKIDNVLSLTLRGVVNNDPDNPEGLVPKDYRTYQIFDQDDLVFKLIDLENVRTSRVGLVHEQGIMSSAYIRLTMDGRWSARFLYYYFYHLYQAEVFNKIGSGVRSTLGPKDLLDLPIPVLPKKIQERIAAFLDDKTDKIDRAIKIKEEQIALLRERKQIIIQEAVTKGLNSDVPMKDSGIDWIGQIPVHWEIKKLFGLCHFVRGNSAFSKDELLSDGDYVALQYGKTYKVEEIGDSYGFYVNKEFYKESQIVNFGDTIIISTSETIEDLGHSIIYNRDDLGLLGGEQILIKPNSDLLDHYYTYYSMRVFLKELRRCATGVKVFRFNINDLKTIYTPIPPVEEQVDIASRIRSKLGEVDKAISLKQAQIEKLKEYKATLINAAVTGAIKVI